MLFALPCYSTFRTVTFSEDSEDKLRPFKRGKFCHFLFFDSNCLKIATKFSLEIMTEFCENLLKNQSQVDPKSLKISPKWGPGGILGRPGALLGAQEGSGSIFD